MPSADVVTVEAERTVPALTVSIDAAGMKLRPGMMVEVYVDVAD